MIASTYHVIRVRGGELEERPTCPLAAPLALPIPRLLEHVIPPSCTKPTKPTVSFFLVYMASEHLTRQFQATLVSERRQRAFDAVLGRLKTVSELVQNSTLGRLSCNSHNA